jgi:hypothetical protein
MLTTKILSSKKSCVKCGENLIKIYCNSSLGYCQECADLLHLGQNKDKELEIDSFSDLEIDSILKEI